MLRRRGPSQFQFWVIALLLGSAAGYAAVLFRKGISALEGVVYQTGDVARLHSQAEHLPWFWVLLVPVAGGLIVGLVLHRFTDDGFISTLAHVPPRLCRAPISVPSGLTCDPTRGCLTSN